MKEPTEKQIKEECAKLRKMKPTLLEQSSFGDNHHHALEAQIEVMEDFIDEDAIDDRAVEEDWEDNVRDAAHEAYQWMSGNKKISPSENWSPLCKKTK